jgi:hypothetical protein
MDMAANDTVVVPYAHDGPNRNVYEDALKKCVLPASREYPSGETFEEYLARLLDEVGKAGWSAGCGKPFPGWVGELSGMAPGKQLDPVMNVPMEELTDAEMERIISTSSAESRQLIKDAIEQTKRSRGTIPRHLQDVLEELIAEPKTPWHQVFRGYLKTALSSKLAESAAYPNPALFHLAEDGIEPYTGYQKEFTFNMAILIDSSGSISNEDYSQFIGEIQGIAKAEPGATALLVYFDAAVQKIETLTLAPDTLEHPYRYSYGGTDFKPPFQYILGMDTACDASMEGQVAIRKRWDVVVMLTDGEAPIESPGGPCPDLLPPCPVIWALVGRQAAHPAMGSRIVKIGD